MNKLVEYYIFSQEAEKHLLAGNQVEYKRHLDKARIALMQHTAQKVS